MSDHKIEINGELWFNSDQHAYIGAKRVDLLEQIAIWGSISKAAKKAGMSYRAAWDAVNVMNNLSPKPLVICATGGAGGGGTQLTPLGKQLVYTWRRMQAEYERFLKHVADGIENFDDMSHLLRAIAMKTSARNQFRGTVKKITLGAVNADVILAIGDDFEIFANITNEAIEDMQLSVGKTATALVKSSFVLLSPDPDIRISARNRLHGTVVTLIPGAVNSELKLELAGGKILTAVVTKESIEEFSFAPGQPCTALIKASHVIIAID